MALPAPEAILPPLPTQPTRAESPTPGPSVAEPILEEVLDSVFAQVEADLKDILLGGANNWSFDVESSLTSTTKTYMYSCTTHLWRFHIIVTYFSRITEAIKESE